MIETIHIFDLDGCIIDSIHRYKTLPCGTKIDLDYWIKNCTKEKINKDGFLPLYSHYKTCVNDSTSYVIIATSRQANEHDLDFINKHLAGYNKLIYRATGDTQRGYTLKCNPIKPLLNLKQFQNCLIKIYEDNREQLKIMCNILNAKGYYIPSNQGH